MKMAAESFSKRFGYAHASNPEITIRDDAPTHIREGTLLLAEGDMDLQPSLIRDVLCRVLRTTPDRSNWSEYPNVWEECQYLIERCPWYKVYDFVEAVHAQLSRT
jgi:hypothetical protein